MYNIYNRLDLIKVTFIFYFSKMFRSFLILIFLCFNNFCFFGQEKSLFDLGRYEEYKQELLLELEQSNPKIPLTRKLELYTDLGKVYTIQKQYTKSLFYLLKAKKLNSIYNSPYTHYNVALGQLFMDLNAYSVSIAFYKKEINKAAYLNNYYQLSTIGSLYLKLFEYDSAHYYFQLQLKVANLMNDYIGIASSLNNIGFSALKAHKLTDAITYFEKAKDIVIANKNTKSTYFQDEYTTFLSSVLANIGQCYLEKKNYAIAIKKLAESIKLVENQQDDFNVYKFQLMAYIGLKNRDKSRQILSRFNPLALNLDNKIEYYDLQNAYYLLENDVKKSISTLVKLKACQKEKIKQDVYKNDLMNRLVSKLLISESNEKIALEKKKKNAIIQQNKLDKLKNKLIISLLVLISSVVIMLSIFVFLFNKNKRRKVELEKQALEFEDEKLRQKLTIQKSHLTEFALDKKIKEENSKELLKNLQHLRKQDVSEVKSTIDELIFDIKQKEKHFSTEINQINETSELLMLEFKQKLKEIHPDLNDSELFLCQLICLKLSNKEIANYKNITLQSVKISKNRLKKKMNISSSDSITSYINNILIYN